MRIDTLDITAPAIFGFGASFNEAEALGSAVWLWMHSPAHRDAPLHTLSALLLPAIKTRQFVLATQLGKPVFFLSWANLSEEAESRYLHNPPVCMPEADWNSGERMWILDWVAPFGHSRMMRHILERHLFPTWQARALYHRGNERGLRIKTFHGMAVLPEEARHWFQTHPVATNIPCDTKPHDFFHTTTEGNSK
jgi:cytolysin-activating lysine-acyltransferase